MVSLSLHGLATELLQPRGPPSLDRHLDAVWLHTHPNRGGNIITLPEVTTRANYAAQYAGGAQYGLMLWSLHKTGCPSAQQITSAACTAYNMTGCSSPLPQTQSACSSTPPPATPSPSPPPPAPVGSSPSPPAPVTSSPAPPPTGSCATYAAAGGACGSAVGGACCPSGQCCSQYGESARQRNVCCQGLLCCCSCCHRLLTDALASVPLCHRLLRPDHRALWHRLPASVWSLQCLARPAACGQSQPLVAASPRQQPRATGRQRHSCGLHQRGPV